MLSSTAFASRSYYAMVRTIEEDCFIGWPTFFALLCIVGQVLVLNGILFKVHSCCVSDSVPDGCRANSSCVVAPCRLAQNFVAEVPNIVSWGDLARYKGLPEEKVGFLAGLLISPIILLAKLTSNGEFMDIGVFSATLKTYETSPQYQRTLRVAGGSPHERANPKYSAKRWAIMAFWVIVHGIRTFYIVPLFVFVNAKMMADVDTIMAVLTTNVGLSFLLDLDDNLFSALYGESEEALDYCKKDMGVATHLVCESFKGRMAQALFAMQMLGVIHFKFAESLLDMWALPAFGLVLLLVALYEFPTNRPVVVCTSVSFLVVYVVWFLNTHCYLVPSTWNMLSPEACDPYVAPWYFFPNTTSTTNTLRPTAT